MSRKSNPDAQRLTYRSAATLALLVLTGSAAAQLPEIPVLSRDVHLIEDGTALHPHIPPLRTSADGRVGLDMKNKRLFLLSPERLTTSFLEGPAGATILANTSGIQLTDADLHTYGTGVVSLRHAAVCDVGYPSASCPSGRCPNPRACGNDDCYDLTIVTPVLRDDLPPPFTVELWKTDFTVQVSNPKTDTSAMTLTTVGTPQKGSVHNMGTIFETMITADGKLMVGRLGGSHQSLPGIDIAYNVIGETENACDVNAWDDFRAITAAHTDPEMVGRYGFAAYPLRDPTGAAITPGLDLRGTYPWIDREGSNLFFTAIRSQLWYRPDTLSPFTSRYPVSCVPGTSCVANQDLTFDLHPITGVKTHDDAGATRGSSVAGLWTHGKMVLLDGLINNIDYGMRIPSTLQRMVHLYEPNTGPGGDGQVRLGTGRHNGGAAGVYPPGYINNSTFIDSLEQLANANEHMPPLTLRDVVWTVNTGHVSDEVAFDDWIDPNAFIVSAMTPSMAWAGGSNNRFDLFDGFERTGFWEGLGFSGAQPTRVQNSATAVATDWSIPPWGEVFGNGRIEPGALGGIRGRGLWLDGQTGARYPVVPQPQDPDATYWFVGVFLDARFADDTTRRLIIRFPDESRLELEGRRKIHFVDDAGLDLASYTLSAAQALPSPGWAHLGLVVHPGGTKVRLYLNGDRIKTWNAGAGQKLFGMVPPGATGELYLGKVEGGSEEGFRGWLDELKVIAENPKSEVICNHARGTLIEQSFIQTVPFPVLGGQAPRGPVPDQATAVLKLPRVVRSCYHDYTSEPGAHLKNLPANAKSIRSQILFPEGPLEWNEPRPESSTNAFCLSCHVDSHVTSSLKVEALVKNPLLDMWEDPRRQPLQPPALISGHIPAGLYGSEPQSDQIAPPEGEKQDQWVSPDLP